MLKNTYFISIEKFNDPFGLIILENSYFMFNKEFDEDFVWVYFYDEEENCAYPIIAPKRCLIEIDKGQIKNNIIKSFEDIENI